MIISCDTVYFECLFENCIITEIVHVTWLFCKDTAQNSMTICIEITAHLYTVTRSYRGNEQ